MEIDTTPPPHTHTYTTHSTKKCLNCNKRDILEKEFIINSQ